MKKMSKAEEVGDLLSMVWPLTSEGITEIRGRGPSDVRSSEQAGLIEQCEPCPDGYRSSGDTHRVGPWYRSTNSNGACLRDGCPKSHTCSEHASKKPELLEKMAWLLAPKNTVMEVKKRVDYLEGKLKASGKSNETSAPTHVLRNAMLHVFIAGYTFPFGDYDVLIESGTFLRDKIRGIRNQKGDRQ